MNNHAKHYLLLVGAKVLRVPLALLVVSLLSRLIGPEGVGQWSMLVAVSTFFHSVFLNWTQAPSVRFGREEWINSNSLSTTWGARRPLIFFGFILALFLLVLRPFSFFEQLTFLPSSWWPLAGVYLLGLWCLAEVQSLLTITENYKILAVLPLLVDTLLVFFLFFLILVPNEELKNNAIIGLVALTAFFWGGAWTKEFIRKMYDLANRKVIFNAISTYTTFRENNMYYMDPFVISDYIIKNLSQDLMLSHGQLPYNFQIVINKDKLWETIT